MLICKTVLLKIVPGTFEELFLFFNGQLLGKALATMMDNFSVAVIPHFPAGFMHAFAEIHFLKPQEKILVEQANFINDLPANHEV